MLKLDANRLTFLGAPAKCGAQQIEDWLRAVLRGGTLRLENGLVELRGGEPVVTTLGDLKKACNVAMETVKQGLRALEMDHWVVLVDGAHTHLLGPPRFCVSVTKENIWGSVGQAIELSLAGELNPLESIDYDQLRKSENVHSRKQTLVLEKISLDWLAQVRLANGSQRELKPGDAFTLAGGSTVRDESGRPAMVPKDLPVKFHEGRDVRTVDKSDVALESETEALPKNSLLHLERSSIVRLADGQTGILETRSRTLLENGENVDWGDDGQWLSRFPTGAPLVFFRRAIYATLEDIVSESCPRPANLPANQWNVALGVHDCFLDGLIPFRAGKCSQKKSVGALVAFLQSLGDEDSLRQSLESEYKLTVGSADVRISPTMFASAYDKELLRQIGLAQQFNSEMLSLSKRIPCWAQVGAYHRKGETSPWEITRELYLTYVDMHYRQNWTKG
jgi:hypothetical protein